MDMMHALLNGPHGADFFTREEGRIEGTRVTASAWIGDDGALVIQLDTTERDPHVRVWLNDGSIFDQNVETNEDFGDDAHGGAL